MGRSGLRAKPGLAATLHLTGINVATDDFRLSSAFSRWLNLTQLCACTRFAAQLRELLSKLTILARSRKGGNKAHSIVEVQGTGRAKSGTMDDNTLQYRQDIVFLLKPDGLGRYTWHIACHEPNAERAGSSNFIIASMAPELIPSPPTPPSYS